MRRLITGRFQRELLTSLLLVAIAFRALIPAGFMPSAQRPFSLEICHAGTLGSGHTVPPDHRSRIEHCPFGSAPGTAPLPSLPRVAQTGLTAAPAIGHFATLRLGVRLDRAHAARAPPFLA